MTSDFDSSGSSTAIKHYWLVNSCIQKSQILQSVSEGMHIVTVVLGKPGIAGLSKT